MDDIMAEIAKVQRLLTPLRRMCADATVVETLTEFFDKKWKVSSAVLTRAFHVMPEI